MKKQDMIKVGIAVVCLLIAGVAIMWQFGGGGGDSPSPNQAIGDTGVTVEEATRMTEEELRDLAEEQGAMYGGTGGGKPQRRPR